MRILKGSGNEQALNGRKIFETCFPQAEHIEGMYYMLNGRKTLLKTGRDPDKCMVLTPAGGMMNAEAEDPLEPYWLTDGTKQIMFMRDDLELGIKFYPVRQLRKLRTKIGVNSPYQSSGKASITWDWIARFTGKYI